MPMSKIIEQAAAGVAVVAAINQGAIATWAAAATAVAFVVGKGYADYRDRKRNADQADAQVWSERLAAAAEKLGEAKAQIADLKTQNGSQAAEMKVMQEKIALLGASQNKVIEVVKSNRDQVKDTVKRVGELEQMAGSSSNLSMPATEPSTSIDLPNIR